MGRIGWVSVVAALFFVLITPGLAQTDNSCVQSCLQRGSYLYQYCVARCTNGVPPAQPLAPNRTSAPAQQPAPPSAPALPAAQSTPPLAAPSTPAVPQPAAAQSAPSVTPIQPPAAATQSAPQPTAAQTAPQQAYKPPPPPVDQKCLAWCIDRGRLYGACQKVCTLPVPGASAATPPAPK